MDTIAVTNQETLWSLPLGSDGSDETGKVQPTERDFTPYRFVTPDVNLHGSGPLVAALPAQPRIPRFFSTFEQLPMWHSDAKKIGRLFDTDCVFVKYLKDGSISLIYEQQLRHRGLHGYTLTILDGHILPSDGVGFVFADRVPCSKNIKRLWSVFVNRTGHIIKRMGEQMERQPMPQLPPLQLGNSITLVLDLDQYIALFQSADSKGHILARTKVDLASLAERVDASRGYLCAAVTKSGFVLRMKKAPVNLLDEAEVPYDPKTHAQMNFFNRHRVFRYPQNQLSQAYKRTWLHQAQPSFFHTWKNFPFRTDAIPGDAAGDSYSYQNHAVQRSSTAWDDFPQSLHRSPSSGQRTPYNPTVDRENKTKMFSEWDKGFDPITKIQNRLDTNFGPKQTFNSVTQTSLPKSYTEGNETQIVSEPLPLYKNNSRHGLNNVVPCNYPLDPWRISREGTFGANASLSEIPSLIPSGVGSTSPMNFFRTQSLQAPTQLDFSSYLNFPPETIEKNDLGSQFSNKKIQGAAIIQKLKDWIEQGLVDRNDIYEALNSMFSCDSSRLPRTNSMTSSFGSTQNKYSADSNTLLDTVLSDVQGLAIDDRTMSAPPGPLNFSTLDSPSRET